MIGLSEISLGKFGTAKESPNDVDTEPILLEIQQREQEVLFYLSTTRAETSVG